MPTGSETRDAGRKAIVWLGLALLIGLVSAAPAAGQLTLELTPPRETVGPMMSGGVAYLFEAEPGWGGVVPELFAGFEENLGKLSPFRLRAGASFSGVPYGADSLDTFRALAAPGSWGLSGLVYLMSSHVDASPILPFIAFGAGIKQVAHGRDDLSALIQHYACFAGGVSVGRDHRLALGAEFRRSWHGLTGGSETAFRTLFHSDETEVTSILVTAQSRFPRTGLWLDVSWREVTNREAFDGFDEADEAVSLGLRYDLDLP